MQIGHLKHKARGTKDQANSQDKKPDDDSHQRLRPEGLIASQKNAWDIA